MIAAPKALLDQPGFVGQPLVLVWAHGVRACWMNPLQKPEEIAVISTSDLQDNPNLKTSQKQFFLKGEWIFLGKEKHVKISSKGEASRFSVRC